MAEEFVEGVTDLGAEDVLDLSGVEGESSGASRQQFYCLAGTLVRDKPCNTKALMEVMRKSWKVEGVFSMSQWANNMILFKFGSEEERGRILASQPWHFDGSLFAIKALEGHEQPSNFTIDSASLWIRVYDVPISCMTDRVGTLLAGKVGILDKIDPIESSYCTEFIRMKVSLNIQKPLTRGITIRLRGELMWLPIKYESMPTYCFCCGIIGHQLRTCPDYDRNECPDISDLKFGPILQASPLKGMKRAKDREDKNGDAQRNLAADLEKSHEKKNENGGCSNFLGECDIGVTDYDEIIAHNPHREEKS